jgi:transcription elongation factor GreA-like protein
MDTESLEKKKVAEILLSFSDYNTDLKSAINIVKPNSKHITNDSKKDFIVQSFVSFNLNKGKYLKEGVLGV